MINFVKFVTVCNPRYRYLIKQIGSKLPVSANKCKYMYKDESMAHNFSFAILQASKLLHA